MSSLINLLFDDLGYKRGTSIQATLIRPVSGDLVLALQNSKHPLLEGNKHLGKLRA